MYNDLALLPKTILLLFYRGDYFEGGYSLHKGSDLFDTV